MAKRKKKHPNLSTNRNWLLFRVAGSTTVFDAKHFTGETKEAQVLAADVYDKIIELQKMLRGVTPQ